MYLLKGSDMMSITNKLGMIFKISLLLVSVVILAEVQAYHQTTFILAFNPQVELANK
jgi:hypothetical protein